MHILFIEEHFYPHTGGVCIHILNLAKRLIAKGVKCSALTLRTDNALKEQENHLGIEIYRVASLIEAARFLANGREKYDIVHAHTSRRPKTAICMLAAKRCGYPVVFTPHAYYPARNQLNWLTKFIYDVTLGRWSIRSADCVVNLTEVDLHDGLAIGQVRERSTIIPNSIDYEGIRAVQPAESFRSKYGVDRYVLYVGRITPIKNVEWLVRAMPFVDPTVSLVVVGPDDGEEDRLKRIAGDLSVSDRILWAGRVDFEDLISAYKECEAFVLPSMHEGLPTVVLEAMALERPAIASPKGGTRRLIKEGETGYFCGEDPGSLGRILETLVQANQGNRMGENARQLVQRDYSWDINAQKMLDLYMGLCRIGDPQDTRAHK